MEESKLGQGVINSSSIVNIIHKSPCVNPFANLLFVCLLFVTFEDVVWNFEGDEKRSYIHRACKYVGLHRSDHSNA